MLGVIHCYRLCRMLRALCWSRSLTTMTRVAPRNPLIAIIGATGTGKSQLAVELAKRYNGEIVNGDAMQLYAGLPIITNKITTEEQEGIPHHLLGCIGLHEQTWVVGTFVRNALKVIAEIRGRGRLPILVGGTHYYTQSLLFKDRLAEKEEVAGESDFVEVTSDKYPILKESTEVLLEELTKVDPEMADRWHPNDRRKIQRSLEIYLQTGRKASQIYAEQRQGRKTEEDTQPDAGAFDMRFDTLLFWIHSENDTLRARLDQRVDKMLDQGLLQEVETLNAFANAQAAQGTPVDETRGIWVSIGHKEFKVYSAALAEGMEDQKQLQKLKAEGLERTKIATRQYSKRQVRWIKIKLVDALAEAGSSDSLYLLDGTEVDKFDENVRGPADDLTKRFLEAGSMPEPSSLSSAAAELLGVQRDKGRTDDGGEWTKQHCATCNVTCVLPEQWRQHIRSKTHKKLCAKVSSKRSDD
ncbi:trna isopentenyltransferase like protein [Zymoseptoria brevis]|uniref:tRNA dimethylallyltransferase n=1 Tax=Zymoseptoria brevis TaxID=1047168 RepID=A0A0F4GPF4_9PEZI|nr:trna isopentenyltransferase like protein [Zymoseptoria brevis]